MLLPQESSGPKKQTETPVKEPKPPTPVKEPKAQQIQQSPSTGQKSYQDKPKSNEELNTQNKSPDKILEKTSNDEVKTETDNQNKEVNQSGQEGTQAGNKNENQSIIQKDVKNKDIQKNVKRLNSKLFAAPVEMPDQERKEEKEMSANSSIKTYKTGVTSASDKKSSESVKQSVIDELRRGSKGKPISTRVRRQLSTLSTTDDDRKSTFERKTSKGTLLKGSNVTRANLSRQSSGSSNGSVKSKPKARTTTNSRWTWDDPDLAKHLTIQKVKSDELSPEPMNAPPNTSMSNYPSKATPDGTKVTATGVKTENVKPKKIMVKPKDVSPERVGGKQSVQRRASNTVMGKGLGPESPDRPLPERTPSKACSIQ